MLWEIQESNSVQPPRVRNRKQGLQIFVKIAGLTWHLEDGNREVSDYWEWGASNGGGGVWWECGCRGEGSSPQGLAKSSQSKHHLWLSACIWPHALLMCSQVRGQPSTPEAFNTCDFLRRSVTQNSTVLLPTQPTHFLIPSTPEVLRLAWPAGHWTRGSQGPHCDVQV